jgi:NADH dehydrogenase (ubiquinone) 1 beta subcomplex subunit 8
MAFVLFCRSSKLVRVMPSSFPLTLIRNGSHGPPGRWNPDWRASPQMPRTMEERIATAKKYNLHPADYKVYNNPDAVVTGHGDYPDLPAISYAERNPYEAWDMPELRRNFGEPLHIDFDMYTGDRCDTRRSRKSTLYMLGVLSGTFVFFFTMHYIFRNIWTFNPMLPKQYPYNDLWVEKGGDPAMMPIRKNYTFETEGVNHQTLTRYL